MSLASPTARCAKVFFSGPGAASCSKFPALFTKHNPLHARGRVGSVRYTRRQCRSIEFPTMIVLSSSPAPATSREKSTTCSPQNSMQYSSSTFGDHPYPNMHSAYTDTATAKGNRGTSSDNCAPRIRAPKSRWAHRCLHPRRCNYTRVLATSTRSIHPRAGARVRSRARPSRARVHRTDRRRARSRAPRARSRGANATRANANTPRSTRGVSSRASGPRARRGRRRGRRHRLPRARA